MPKPYTQKHIPKKYIMATVTKENIGLLHEKLTVKLEKTDYLPSFEKKLKEYSKQANIPGFRKGMVPKGLIKKMYGTSIFADEVLKTVDKELIDYLQHDKLEIFAQPLPLENDFKDLDVNKPEDYTFQFEIGMKPTFDLPAFDTLQITNHVVTVTDEMVDNEIKQLQNRHGNMKDVETVDIEENILNVNFTETDKDGQAIVDGITKENSLLVKYFTTTVRNNWMGKKVGDSETVQLKNAFDEKEREWILSDLGLTEIDNAEEKYFTITISKIGILEKRVLNEEFFAQLYPGQDIKTEEDFRKKLQEDIANHWKMQSLNQQHDQLFHELVEKTEIKFPEDFLKKWIKTQGTEKEGTPAKTDEEVAKEFPGFLQQLKWTLISEKITTENEIQVQPEEIKLFAKQQLFSYMGSTHLSDDQPWVDEYVDKMMKDRKYVEDAYTQIQSRKIFEWADTKVSPKEKKITAEDFTKMVEAHQHSHH